MTDDVTHPRKMAPGTGETRTSKPDLIDEQKFSRGVRDSITWSTLRWLGNSRICRTSYLWILFVPIAAKFLLPVAGTYEVEIFGVRREIVLGLPFSWVRFYFMAVAFALGHTIYALGCPMPVKRFANGDEYLRAHQGVFPIRQWIITLGVSLGPKTFKHLVRKLMAVLRPNREIASEFFDLEQTMLAEPSFHNRANLVLRCLVSLLDQNHDRVVISEAFDVVRETADNTRRGWMCASAVCFAIGLLLLVWVLAEGGYAVWSMGLLLAV